RAECSKSCRRNTSRAPRGVVILRGVPFMAPVCCCQIPVGLVGISASEGHSFCRPVPSRNDLDLLVRASGAPAHTVTRLGYSLAAGQVRIALHLRFPLWQQRSTSWKLAAARRQVELSFSLCSPLWRTAEQVRPQPLNKLPLKETPMTWKS